MKRIYALLLLLCLATGLLLFYFFYYQEKRTDITADSNPPSRTDFIWGVNGKPAVNWAPVYLHTSVGNDQINLLTNLGANWYRAIWSEGSVSQDLFLDFVNRSKAAGINTSLMVYGPNKSSTDDTALLYDQAKSIGIDVASRFNGKIGYFELENEQDNYCIKGAQYTGESFSHYDEIKFQKVLAVIKGLNDGIKQIQPEAKIIVDAGYLHYGFIDEMINRGMDFDILAWHWYSNFGDIARIKDKLTTYNKDIWINEINIRSGTYDKTEQQQADYIYSTAHQVSQWPAFKGYFVYELLDFLDIELRPSNPQPGEAHFGLVQMQKGEDGKWKVGSPKLAYASLHKAIEEISGSKEDNSSENNTSRQIEPTREAEPVKTNRSIAIITNPAANKPSNSNRTYNNASPESQIQAENDNSNQGQELQPVPNESLVSEIENLYKKPDSSYPFIIISVFIIIVATIVIIKTCSP